MQKNRREIASRAWRLLRLALLWARRGGVLVFKRRLAMQLPKLIKSIGQSARQGRGALHYGDRELSFDNTPVIHVKMHRPNSMRFRLPRIPCINPQVNFDYDFDGLSDRNDGTYDGERVSVLKNGTEEDREEEHWFSSEEEGIDLKAEEFIAHFYEQLKLQRQISYLEYH